MLLSFSSFRRVAGLGLAAALGLLGPAACRSTAPQGAVKNAAILRVENHSDHVWRVELAPDAGGTPAKDALRWELPARAKQILTIPAGTYHLRSRIVGQENEEDAATTNATFERMTLKAGTSYSWPLSTLLSEDSPAPTPP